MLAQRSTEMSLFHISKIILGTNTVDTLYKSNYMYIKEVRNQYNLANFISTTEYTVTARRIWHSSLFYHNGWWKQMYRKFQLNSSYYNKINIKRSFIDNVIHVVSISTIQGGP